MTARDVIAYCLAACADEPMDDIAAPKYYTDADCVIADLKAAPDSDRLELAAMLNPWHPLPPQDTWLRTKREGEDGENVCMWRDLGSGEREWIERDGGRTTVTHHSFAAPTEWAYLPTPAPAAEQKP